MLQLSSTIFTCGHSAAKVEAEQRGIKGERRRRALMETVEARTLGEDPKAQAASPTMAHCVSRVPGVRVDVFS